VEVRPGRPEDGEALRAIERAAGEQFRTVGMGWVVDHEPMSVAALAAYAEAGRSWVAVDGAGTPVGYLVAEVVDGCAHVEQVSVVPSAQGTGVGRALMDAARAWAEAEGRPGVTLTTFTDVAWNRPLYEHLGYRVLAEDEVGPELAAVRDAEAAHGLDPATRSLMRLDLA
jgi:GNAT superfamily N-acetyltransferase